MLNPVGPSICGITTTTYLHHIICFIPCNISYPCRALTVGQFNFSVFMHPNLVCAPGPRPASHSSRHVTHRRETNCSEIAHQLRFNNSMKVAAACTADLVIGVLIGLVAENMFLWKHQLLTFSSCSNMGVTFSL